MQSKNLPENLVESLNCILDETGWRFPGKGDPEKAGLMPPILGILEEVTLTFAAKLCCGTIVENNPFKIM